MSEAAATPIPRRGRIWVILALALALLAIGYSLVDTATREAGREVVRVAGISDTQRIFGGVPQEGDRVGSADAPVAIQIFNDLQCAGCRADFLRTVPSLVEDFARPGEVKLLMRHYSVAYAPHVGFYAAEAAARQGYGWQYTYLFFRNQDEVERLGAADDKFLESLAGSIGELDVPLWKEDLEREGAAGGQIEAKLNGYEELGSQLGIRAGQAAIVSGPSGTEVLQDGPALGQIERAIETVR